MDEEKKRRKEKMDKVIELHKQTLEKQIEYNKTFDYQSEAKKVFSELGELDAEEMVYFQSGMMPIEKEMAEVGKEAIKKQTEYQQLVQNLESEKSYTVSPKKEEPKAKPIPPGMYQ